MESTTTPLPRLTISFCTQCKWMLRAAYFAQELLSTFSTSLGEVALQPATGGTFVVTLYTAALTNSDDEPVTMQKHLLWDRKAEGGFPETKELKRRVRDVIDPNRDLGHVDGKQANPSAQPAAQEQDAKKSIPFEPQKSSSNSTHISQPPFTKDLFPKDLDRLQGDNNSTTAERKFTLMDLDSSSRSVSSVGKAEGEVVNSRGKIQIGGGEGFGFCRPGEDCEDCG